MRRRVFVAVLSGMLLLARGCEKSQGQKAQDRKLAALERQLKSSKAEARAKAALSLGNMGPAAEPATLMLVEALEDEEAEVRRQVARALGKIGPGAAAAAPALRQAFNDEDPLTVVWAAEAVARINPEAKPPLKKLIKIMKGRDEAAAVNAPHAMGAFGARAEAAVPDLIEALKNTDLAMHAACGLGDIGPAAKEAVAALEVVARRRDRAGEEAAAALLKIRQ